MPFVKESIVKIRCAYQLNVIFPKVGKHAWYVVIWTALTESVRQLKL